MANIGSRETLEAWLGDKPFGWSKMIAGRAALRALPYGVVNAVRANLTADFNLGLFRTTFLASEAGDSPSPVMVEAAARSAGAMRAVRARRPRVGAGSPGGAARAADAAAYAAARAADVVRFPEAGAPDSAACFIARASFAAHAEAFAAARDTWFDPAVRFRPEEQTPIYAETWAAVARDCAWLADRSGGRRAEGLAGEPLWLGETPERWRSTWLAAAAHLLGSEPSYQLWVDWYERRIVGRTSAFEIPQDDGRIQEEVVVTQIAEASDEHFWSRGPAHVNVTINGWLEQARELLTLPIFELIKRAIDAGTSPRFSDADDPAARAGLVRSLTVLATELARSRAGGAGIGHNHPPPLDLGRAEASDAAAVIEEGVRIADGIAFDMEAPEPDRREIADKLSRLQKIGQWLAGKGDLMAGAAAKAMGAAVGATLGVALVSPGTLEAIRSALSAGAKWLLSVP
jgi:hypothetical protein